MWIGEVGRICKEYAYALSGTAYWNEEAGDIELKSAQTSAANERRRQAEMQGRSVRAAQRDHDRDPRGL
jgi:hypothetical protein